MAVVLAGGLGTRIRHLLGDLPKPMAPVHGRPFLEWVVRYLAGQGIRRVVLSTGYRSEAVKAHFEGQPVPGVKVQSVSESEPMGTAGGFLHAARASGEDASAWLVLNGDSMALANLEPLKSALADPAVEGAVLAVTMSDASRYGTVEGDAAGELVGFREKQPGAGQISAGVYLLRDRILRSFPERMPLSFERDVFPELLARKVRLKVCVTQAAFLDIGTPESLRLAEAFIQDNADSFATG